MAEIEHKFETLVDAPIVEVELETEQGYMHGMQSGSKEVKTSQLRRGYTIYDKVCVRCGTSATHDNDRVFVEKTDRCLECKGQKFGHINAVVTKKQTEDIINKTVCFKCVNCERIYDNPEPCCTRDALFTKADVGKWLRGYMCLGCGAKYQKKIKCCYRKRLSSGMIFIPEGV